VWRAFAQSDGMSMEQIARLVKRKTVIEEALKRWLKRRVRSITEISTRERLCEEVWRPKLIRYIKKTGAGMKSPKAERREEWEIQIDNQ
jgi:hypothetical protein